MAGCAGAGENVLQGLIQVAAAFHHHSRENARGAKSLLAAGVAKLQGFPEGHRGIAVSDLRTEAKSWLEEIEAGSVVESRALPLIRMLDAPSGGGGEETAEMKRSFTALARRTARSERAELRSDERRSG